MPNFKLAKHVTLNRLQVKRVSALCSKQFHGEILHVAFCGNVVALASF